MRIKVGALSEPVLCVGSGHLERAGRARLCRDQVVAEEERAVAHNGLEAKPGKPGCDELGGQIVLGRRGEAPTKVITCEVEQVGFHFLTTNRVVLGRTAVRRNHADRQGAGKRDAHSVFSGPHSRQRGSAIYSGAFEVRRLQRHRGAILHQARGYHSSNCSWQAGCAITEFRYKP